ncbi:hypothetical protein CLF_100633 [Clonorchis sinensis]|uniref:Uncharacterized protein n=1 Tax=Clonorchis sinensis TaxID=79923 RepID=G7Y3W6_CLOSI|nr:hypothetical protein CLF_100633 [Clonorchis sinensis]
MSSSRHLLPSRPSAVEVLNDSSSNVHLAIRNRYLNDFMEVSFLGFIRPPSNRNVYSEVVRKTHPTTEGYTLGHMVTDRTFECASLKPAGTRGYRKNQPKSGLTLVNFEFSTPQTLSFRYDPTDGGEVFGQRSSFLLTNILEKETVSDNWAESVMVTVFKKGTREERMQANRNCLRSRTEWFAFFLLRTNQQDFMTGKWCSAVILSSWRVGSTEWKSTRSSQHKYHNEDAPPSEVHESHKTDLESGGPYYRADIPLAAVRFACCFGQWQTCALVDAKNADD